VTARRASAAGLGQTRAFVLDLRGLAYLRLMALTVSVPPNLWHA
jgi:hypothetical protein